jgi:hypothetical protein
MGVRLRNEMVLDVRRSQVVQRPDVQCKYSIAQLPCISINSECQLIVAIAKAKDPGDQQTTHAFG